MTSVKMREFQHNLGMYKLVKAGRKNKEFPLAIEIQTINRCNAKCVMCPYTKITSKEEKVKMSFFTYKKLVDEVSKENSFLRLIIAFESEPLLDTDIIKFAKYYKEKCPKKQLQIVTNGVLLDSKIIDDVYKYFDIVDISVNAHSEKSYKKMMVGLDYDKLIENLNNISKNKNYVEKTVIRFIKIKNNEQEQKKFKKYWNDKGFVVFGFDINDRLGTVKQYERIRPKTNLLKLLKLKLLKIIGKLILPVCSIPFFTMYIHSTGECVLCFNDWEKKTLLGNINQNSIKEIFNSEKYMNYRKNINNFRDENNICKDCKLIQEGLWLTI